jgi:hypothetical protein
MYDSMNLFYALYFPSEHTRSKLTCCGVGVYSMQMNQFTSAFSAAFQPRGILTPGGPYFGHQKSLANPPANPLPAPEPGETQQRLNILA